MPVDYQKAPSDQRQTVAIAPTSDATGLENVHEPTAAELNNTAGSGFVPASQSISWNDWDFGTQASEVTNEPSLADAASYEEFGQRNYGGGVSFYMPRSYDDNSNLHSVIYDLTDTPGDLVDIAVRIDGDVETDVPFEDGDFVSAYEVRFDSETNPFTPGESKRRTVGFSQAGGHAHYVVVGEHEITTVDPASFAVGDTGRIRALQQGRDVTAYLNVSTSDGDVIDVHRGGFYEVIGEGEATVTFEDPGTGDVATVAVTAGPTP